MSAILPEVFRGMQLEAAPLRLARVASAPPAATGTPQPAASPQPPAADAFRQAFEQGLREGREAGLRAGHEEGLRQGRAAAAAEVDAAVQQAVDAALQPLQQEHAALQELARGLAGASRQAAQLAQDEIVALCFETTCRLVGEAAVQPQAVRALVTRLIAGQADAQSLVLHLHPQDAALMEQGAVAAGTALPVPCRPDPEVALGGCLLRTPRGGLDARLETSLGACKEALLAARARLAGASENAQP